jgi:hypothetical protein
MSDNLLAGVRYAPAQAVFLNSATQLNCFLKRDPMTTSGELTADDYKDVGRAVISGTISAFRSNKGFADKAITQLPDDKLHVALDVNTNSIAVTMKHVAGNLRSRWTDFLTTDGEKPWRNRDEEFVDTFTSRDQLVDYWESGWATLFDSLSALSCSDLANSVTIRGEVHSVPLAMQRSLGHTTYHIGQIVLISRILAGDNWTTITIPRGGSTNFNQKVWGAGHYQTPPEAEK